MRFKRNMRAHLLYAADPSPVLWDFTDFLIPFRIGTSPLTLSVNIVIKLKVGKRLERAS